MASMSFDRNVSGGALQLRQVTTVSADNINVFTDITVAADQVDDPLIISLDVDLMKGFYMLVTGGNITIETNIAGTPADTVNLIADEPVVWTGATDLYSNPFGTDVTKFFLTTGAGDTRTLNMIFVQDSTV